MSPMKRKQYSDAALARAVDRVVVGGDRAVHVGREENIPYRSLLKYVARRRRGESIAPKRRGPRPALSDDGERQLLHWMRELQAAGLPVRRHELIARANEVLQSQSGPHAEVSSGWFTRFRARHPEVSGPGAQMVIAEEGQEEQEQEQIQEKETQVQEQVVVERKTKEQLRKEQLLSTPVEKAVFTVQESYAGSWPAQDVVDAFDVMLDPGKADLFSVMEAGELRDMWLKKQLRMQRTAARN